MDQLFVYTGEAVCAISFTIVFLVLKLVMPYLSTDSALACSAEITLLLVYFLHSKEDANTRKRRSARMCTLCTISCLSWLMCMGNRKSSHVIFEAGFMVVLPFINGLGKSSYGWYFRQRDINEADIQAATRFFLLHFVVVFVGIYSIRYVSDVDDVKMSMNALNETMTKMNLKLNGLNESMAKMNLKLNGLNESIEIMNMKINGLDIKINGLDKKMNGLDKTMTKMEVC